MRPEDFFETYNVVPQKQTQFLQYHDLLIKWQKAINLVGPKTLADVWRRHFADSTQLAAYLPGKSLTIADLGSGAGFPGLVLALLDPDRPVILVEADQRKCEFLKTVTRETKSDNVQIVNARIEKKEFEAKIWVSRALAPITTFCEWAVEAESPDLYLQKGQRGQEELNAAQKEYEFNWDSFPSATDNQSRIYHLSGIKRRACV